MKVAIIGAGWAGMAAAVAAARLGHSTVVFEASRTLGGRARAVQAKLPDGSQLLLDNGQHILIGAYTQTLQLMRLVGLDPGKQLMRLPLALPYPDGSGLALPDWPSPFDALGGILRNPGWTWQDKWSMLRAAALWQVHGFQCDAQTTVYRLCNGLTPRVIQTLIEPLCVSALNTPAHRASAQVFLRVLKDSLFGVSGGSNLLLPRTDLTALFPGAAAAWVAKHRGQIHTGSHVDELLQTESGQWQVHGALFDVVLLAGSSSATALLLQHSAGRLPSALARMVERWAMQAQSLEFEEIATVYALANQVRLAQPMLALHSDAQRPAQFVFDKGQLGGPHGLLAFVVSANSHARTSLQALVLEQARVQLAGSLGNAALVPVQTIVEKRATFACTPGLQRPAAHIAPGLMACGDYVDGPYPATLEGAVRSGIHAGSAVLADLAEPHTLSRRANHS